MKDIKNVEMKITWDSETNNVRLNVNADKKLEFLNNHEYNLVYDILRTALKFVEDQRLIEQDIKDLTK